MEKSLVEAFKTCRNREEEEEEEKESGLRTNTK